MPKDKYPGIFWHQNEASVFIILQAPVVQKLDNAIHRINRYPVDKCWQNKPRYPLIFPVDSVVHLSNNPSLIFFRSMGSFKIRSRDVFRPIAHEQNIWWIIRDEDR